MSYYKKLGEGDSSCSFEIDPDLEMSGEISRTCTFNFNESKETKFKISILKFEQ